VVVEGLDDVWVRLARCCTPVPGDDILGFVTRGRGVSVHRTDCANAVALRSADERVIEATWDPTVKGAVTVSVQVEAFDRPYLLRDVSAALSAEGINILGSSSWTGRDRVAVLRFDLELSDHSILDRVLRTVRKVESVYDAYRQTPARTAART
jgi:GTP pyrophosphokinase